MDHLKSNNFSNWSYDDLVERYIELVDILCAGTSKMPAKEYLKMLEDINNIMEAMNKFK